MDSGEVAERVLAGIAALADLPPSVDEVAALSEAETLLTALARLQALVGERLLDLDQRDATDVAGYPSVTAWTRSRLGADPRDAARVMRLARLARRHPATGDAFRSGDVSAAHLTTVDHAVRRLPADLAGAGDEFLAGHAPDFTPDEFRVIAAQWRDTVTPDLAAEERDDAVDEQHLTLSPTDGGTLIRGWLTGLNAAWLVAALDRHAMPLPDDQRPAARRRADALGDLARLALTTQDTVDAGNPAPALPVATVTVLTDPLTLQRALDARAQTPGWLPAGPRELTHPAVDERTGAPLSTAELLTLTCDSPLNRALLDTDSELLDLGRATRLFTKAQRRALARGQRPTCHWHRCHSPWVEAHHQQPWSHDGTTDLDNGQLLCRYHHTLTHLGWHLPHDGPPQPPPDWHLRRHTGRRSRRTLAPPLLT